VVAYFVGRGIDADRLTVEARGADDPLAPGDDDASLQANRSVEFIILGLID
jgi:outer membrane protein OmpA-like peptidoglycan-associated protein